MSVAAEVTPKGDPGEIVEPRRRASKRFTQVPFAIASLLLFAVLWQGVSLLVGADVLPAPLGSLQAVVESYHDGTLLPDMAITAMRIVGAFAIALVVSVVAGALLGWSRTVERLFGPWVTILASTPSLLIIIIAYLLVGLNDRGAMVGTAIVVAPSMTYAVWDGMRAITPDLQEMARAFGLSKGVILRRVLIPQTTPFIFNAARTGLSLAWRIMIFVELLGRSTGVGYRVQYFYNIADMRRVVGAALPFIVVMLAFEFGVLRPIERWVFRWRRQETR